MRLRPSAAMLILTAMPVGCDVRFSFNEPTATEIYASPPVPSKQEIEKPAPPEPRPAWVDQPTGLHGGVYETIVLVGPEPNRAACEVKLPPLVEAAVLDYVTRAYGPDAPTQLDLRYVALRSRVVGSMWEEQVTTTDETRTFLHTQLRFDDKLRSEWQRSVDQWTTKTRTGDVLRSLAVGMAAVLAVHLALRFGGPRKVDA